jgi:hypothetical protein
VVMNEPCWSRASLTVRKDTVGSKSRAGRLVR